MTGHYAETFASSIHDERVAHENRVTELLRTNTEYLERARRAEKEAIEARKVARMAIMVAGEMAKTMGPL